MTRQDCIWVAIRCTGLLFLVIAVMLLPELYATLAMQSSDSAKMMGMSIPGMGGMSDVMASARRINVIHAILQIFLPTGCAYYFLSGAQGLSRWLMRT